MFQIKRKCKPKPGRERVQALANILHSR